MMIIIMIIITYKLTKVYKTANLKKVNVKSIRDKKKTYSGI